MHTKRSNGARTILTVDDMRAGVRALRRKCQHMRRIHDTAGDPPLRDYTAGFAGLARIVVGQQLSLASARAIWGRLALAVEPMTAEGFLALDDDALRAAGLSRGKVRTLRALAEAVVAGLDLDSLAHASDAEVHETLTALPGIGPWTVDVYLLFCLGRADAFAAGDLALQIAARTAMGLKEKPSRQELYDIAERWRPWRGIAAHLLWAHYKVARAPAAVPKNA
jgi:DNA-3-methyladenine glycosylase II